MENVRASHWVKPNHHARIPKRWITFDTESTTEVGHNEEIQTFASAAAFRWRRDLRTGTHEESSTFESPESLWDFVAGYCRAGVRTICVAHNLSYDVRVSAALAHLPRLGFSLEWCNLDRNVSAMTWRSDHGTLILCDLFTWIPKPLFEVGNMLGLSKLKMPSGKASKEEWDRYCLRDAEIVARAVQELVDFVEKEDLGNWQPTGAGMAYSTWRHKFMSHRVLVHDDTAVLDYEREAMHTGRAEAWRHGTLHGDTWHEVDLRSAYTRIAAECELPAKHKFSHGRITQSQYEELSSIYRVLCHVRINQDKPIAPFYTGDRTIWPIGEFDTKLWDVEVNELLAENQGVSFLGIECYTKAPVLRDWATWTLSVTNGDILDATPVVRAWTKHSGRALIGRLSLRVPSWEVFGANPYGTPGISYDVDYDTTSVHRMMHIGDKTFVETNRVEGRDSVPQITGWIMAECRIRLWWAMCAAGFDNVAHVDTDSVLVNSEGLRRLKAHYGATFKHMWQVKATWNYMTVYGPRNLRAGRDRKVAGVPKGAKEVQPNVFVGERWRGLAADMAGGRADAVTIVPAQWEMNTEDPRRRDAPTGEGQTVAIRVDRNGYVL